MFVSLPLALVMPVEVDGLAEAAPVMAAWPTTRVDGDGQLACGAVGTSR